MGLLELLKKALSAYDRLAYYILTFLLSLIAVILFTNVIFRYFFYAAFSWAEELTLFLMIWVAGIAARPALKSGEFITIDSLQRKLSKTSPIALLIVRIIVLAAIFVYLLVVLVSGIDLCLKVQRQTSPMLVISMAIPYAAMPFGALVMLITAVEQLVQTLKEGKKEIEP